MAVPTGWSYEIRINNTDGDLNGISATVQDFRFWSPELWAINNEFGMQNVPLAEGGVHIGEGYRKPRTFNLLGSYDGLIGNANESYPGSHLAKIYEFYQYLDIYRNTEMYVDIETQKTSGTTSVRRLYAKPYAYRWNPVEGARYTLGEMRVTMLAADCDFYYSTESSASASGASCSASAAVTAKRYDTQRLTIRVYNSDGNDLANVSASSTAGTWSLAGSITASGDYYEIDHYAGTVSKVEGGTAANAIDEFTGTFFPVQYGNTEIIIQCASATAYTEDFEMQIYYRNKADWAI